MEDRIYLTPSFSLLIADGRGGQRYIPLGGPVCLERPMPSASGPERGERVSRFGRSGFRYATREALLLAIAAAAAFLFLNHSILYMDGPPSLADVPIEAYLLATGVLYLFVRIVIVAAELRPVRAPADPMRCPECGQWLDDPTAAGLAAHRRIELTPRPSPKEVVSAVALRRAVDAVRQGAVASPAAEGIRLRAEPDNGPGVDLVAALNDPDFLERARHSPRPPQDPKIKR